MQGGLLPLSLARFHCAGTALSTHTVRTQCIDMPLGLLSKLPLLHIATTTCQHFPSGTNQTCCLFASSLLLDYLCSLHLEWAGRDNEAIRSIALFHLYVRTEGSLLGLFVFLGQSKSIQHTKIITIFLYTKRLALPESYKKNHTPRGLYLGCCILEYFSAALMEGSLDSKFISTGRL